MNDTTLPITPKESTTRRRKKAPIRKGFALHDWKNLLASTNDLAQLKGQSPYRLIPLSEIQNHNKIPHDSWIILHGKVYNIGPYLHYHPGGIEIMKECIGGDATKLFEEYHRWVNVDNLIGKLLIGYLDVNSSSSSNNTKTSALTTDANGATRVSQFSMAPPRPVVRQPLPS